MSMHTQCSMILQKMAKCAQTHCAWETSVLVLIQQGTEPDVGFLGFLGGSAS